MISLCMIVRNERDTLPRCLDSVADAVSEIVVVDTGSIDGTPEIAQAYTPNLYHFPWRDDFAAARNYAFDQATQPFLMWLDADDVLESADALKRFRDEQLERFDFVTAPYHVAFDAQGSPTFTYARERLLRASMGFRWRGAVHEAIAPRGRVGHADFAVRHHRTHQGDSGRNLRIYEGLRARGHDFEPRERFYYGRELLTAGRLSEASEQLLSVARDASAWVENRLQACVDLADCFTRMGELPKAREAAALSMAIAPPRPRTACALAQALLAAGELPAARYWYEAALQLPQPEDTGAFVERAYADYIPTLQLCLICDRMGDRAAAERYHRQAMARWSDDPSVQHNQRYFQMEDEPSGRG